MHDRSSTLRPTQSHKGTNKFYLAEKILVLSLQGSRKKQERFFLYKLHYDLKRIGTKSTLQENVLKNCTSTMKDSQCFQRIFLWAAKINLYTTTFFIGFSHFFSPFKKSRKKRQYCHRFGLKHKSLTKTKKNY